MISDQERLDLYLKNSKRGFFIIEVCDFDILMDVLENIKSQKTGLFVDFSQVGADYYNTEIKKIGYDCVIFYNLEFSDDAAGIIDSFNMNRDNFAANGIMYLFILPKYLVNYLVVKTPNLHSYMTGTVDLCRVYESPFRPLLSLDNFVIDAKQIREEKVARRNLKPSSRANTLRELYDDMEYYKYHVASSETLLGVAENAVSILLDERKNSGKKDTENVVKFYLEFSKIAFNQGRYNLAEYVCCLALDVSMELFSGVGIHYDEYQTTRKSRLAHMFAIVVQSFAEFTSNYLGALQLIDSVRVLAAALFYQKLYKDAQVWFNLANTIINYYWQRNFDVDNLLCLNFCDIALCCYKMQGDKVSDDCVFYFDKALQIKEEVPLDVKTLFVLDYNDLVYKIKDVKVRYEDYTVSEGRAEYYRSVCSEHSSIFVCYLSLVAWVRGCIDGNVQGALELNKHALDLKQSVLTENHYSIAESHYCNGVLHFMFGQLDESKRCLRKALNILRVHEKENHTLINIVEGFLREHGNFFEE